MSERPSFYVDTSVWNYAVSPEVGGSHEATREFFEHAMDRQWVLNISELVEIEIGRTPGDKMGLMTDFLEGKAPRIFPITLEIRDLAFRYVEEKVVTSNHLNDALHVAAASIDLCDFLVTWNFKHLANIRKETGFLAVNALSGYTRTLRVCTPLEVYEL